MNNSMEIVCKIPATKALGPLFTLTEIFIWDDGYSGDTGQLTSSKHIRFKYDDDDDDDDDDSKGKISSNGSLESSVDIISVHNEGFTEEMSVLGLPTSFQTNKHNLGGRIKRKSKVLQHSQKRPDEQVEESCKSNEEKPDSDDFQVKSNTSSSSSFPERSEHSGCDSNNGLHEHVQDSSTVDPKTVNNDAGADLQMGIDMSCVDDSSNLTNLEEDLFSDSRNVALLDQEFDDRSRYCGTCGDWSAYWDDLYMRYYFYNAQTKVSTWSPPPGMESFASGESCGSGDVATANLSSALWSDESCVIDDLCQDEITFQKTITNDLMANTSSGTKKTTRKSRRRKKSMVSSEANELYQAEESCIDITKYWCKRYLLFSRFDDGVEMDEEGWFSVTPEAIARHHASRCVGGTVIDCFTGVGGNAIQFAKTSKHVVAIDIDPNKIDYAHHNAVIYGVEDNIDFVTGDSLSVASKLKADTVFLSPPWGGPDYVKVKSYSINMLQPYDGQFLFDTFKAIAPRIIMFLPRNVNIEQLAELSLSADPPWSLEVEKNFLNGHLKAVTAYFSRTSV